MEASLIRIRRMAVEDAVGLCEDGERQTKTRKNNRTSDILLTSKNLNFLLLELTSASVYIKERILQSII